MNLGNTIVVGKLQHVSSTYTQIASGNSVQRPSAVNAVVGAIRYNSSTGKYEGMSDPTLSGTAGWNNISNDLTSVTTSGTGLTATTVNSVVTLSMSLTAGAGIAVSGNTISTALTGGTGITVSGANISGNYVGGTGIVFTGNSVSISLTAGTGISVSGNTISTNLTGGTGITVSGGTISGNYVGGTGITITGNSIAITSPVTVALGGTGAANATAARANLYAAGVYRTSFTSASLVSNLLTVTHSLGQQFVHVQIIDNNNKMIIPDEITFTSSTVSTVDLTSYATITGTWNVVVVG